MNTLLVGAGYWGKNFIRILEKETNNFELKYIVDTQTEIPEYNCLRSLEDLGKYIDNIEAAIVCTPTKTHFEIVKYLLSNNVHVLVEKPLTTKLDQTEDLFLLAKKNNLSLLTDHTFLYNSSVQYIKNLIDSNEVGELLHISFERTNLGPIRSDVSCLWDLATHDISIMNALIEEDIVALTSTGFKNNNELHDIVNISFNFPSKFVSIFASWLHPEKSRKIKIVGTEKMIIYDDINNNEPIKIFDKKVKDFSEKSNNYGSIFNFSIGDVTSPYIQLKEPLVEVVKDFESRILNNVALNELNTEELTLKTISLLEKVDREII
jgi:predicted dehydrogenase